MFCSESAYSAIGEEGVALLHQDSLDHGRVSHAQDGLAAIKNATRQNKRKECEENKYIVESHRQTSSVHKDSPPYFPVFLEALGVKVEESLRVKRNINSSTKQGTLDHLYVVHHNMINNKINE